MTASIRRNSARSKVALRRPNADNPPPPRRSRGTASLVRAFFGLVSCAALLGGCVAISAPVQNFQTPQVPAKPHEPLAGKACVDCHKQMASSKALCLLTKAQMCVLCHYIPAAGGPSRLVEASGQLCFKCHARETFKGSFVHGPFAAGACLTCHDPHGGNNSGMVRITGRQMCLSCHRDMDSQLASARFLHKAAANGCTNCHSPHASEQRFALRAAVPGLCAKCHEDVFREQETAAVKHSPVTEAPACMNCHDPHVGADERLLLADGVDVCLRCHDGSIKAGKGELANIGLQLATNPEHHGPIQSRECSGCHRPHGSRHFRLLADEYPKERYASFREGRYDLCFRCHDSKLVKEERTTTLTGFRDGERNLHYVHVNKTQRGRACGFCHEIHASTLPKHMRVSAPYGTWNLPIKFVKTANGGSCEPACHAAQKYDRQATQITWK